jgi:hypothetical protein
MPPTNKPASRSWGDIQMALAALTMALTLGLWNLFAQPDRVAAEQKAKEAPDLPPATEAASTLAAPAAPTQAGPIKILLGGVAPQTVITVQQPSRGGGGGGGGSVPHTRTS